MAVFTGIQESVNVLTGLVQQVIAQAQAGDVADQTQIDALKATIDAVNTGLATLVTPAP